jgi:hypothetical protein
MSTLATAPPRTKFGCRVWERFPCDLPTKCQPVAARQDKDIVWSGTLRDISVGGVGVVLSRRFEPGMGLAVELPGAEPGMSETLLARVVYVRRLPEGGWLLGCAFISQLSETELDSLLRLSDALQHSVNNPVANLKRVVLQGITFQSEPVSGRVIRLKVKRLVVTGSWPPAPGTVLRVKIADPSGDKIRVTRCWVQAGTWTVAYEFVDRPSAGLLRQLGHKVDER